MGAAATRLLTHCLLSLSTVPLLRPCLMYENRHRRRPLSGKAASFYLVDEAQISRKRQIPCDACDSLVATVVCGSVTVAVCGSVITVLRGSMMIGVGGSVAILVGSSVGDGQGLNEQFSV